jgi:molybdopterin molybdotransferase
MPEFLELLPPEPALSALLRRLNLQPRIELIDAAAAVGRILAQDVTARHALPEFSRSTVDGYAVRSADTYGASDSLPAYLRLAGEVPMGAVPSFTLETGNCGLIHTGGMLPGGADAVVMVEHTQAAGEGEVEVLRAAAVGENVLRIGEDVAAGEVVLRAGRQLRPAEIGGLMALGVIRVEVFARPRVAILSSGDEIVDPGEQPGLGQVRDVNAFSLSALVEMIGGIPVRLGIVADRYEALLAAAQAALSDCDLVVITAGSSASTRDLTSSVINALGKPGVLVHGVNVRPGKPTILAVCDGKPVIGLPGNPVSALVIAALFVTPVVRRLSGAAAVERKPYLEARLTLNLPSQAGREDWVAVRLVQDGNLLLAEPVFGKSNLIFTLSRADGLIRIPANATGLSSGAVVEVFPL